VRAFPDACHAPQASDALQFALHDGGGQWDNADGVPGRNYVAQRAGTYRLTDGQLTLLPPNLPLMLARGPLLRARRAPVKAQRARSAMQRLQR
jgi:hypothetical protein